MARYRPFSPAELASALEALKEYAKEKIGQEIIYIENHYDLRRASARRRGTIKGVYNSFVQVAFENEGASKVESFSFNDIFAKRVCLLDNHGRDYFAAVRLSRKKGDPKCSAQTASKT